MKKNLLSSLFLILMSATTTFSQTHSFDLPKNYVGLGIGFNATGILGITYEHIFKEHIGVYVNLGHGGWGQKIGAGGRLYFRNAHSGAIGINFSHCTGENGARTELGVIEGSQSIRKVVVYDKHPVEVVNVSYLKFWELRHRVRFNIEAGYSVPLDGKSIDNYTIITPGVTLDETSKNTLRVAQPGGLVLAIGFTFGF